MVRTENEGVQGIVGHRQITKENCAPACPEHVVNDRLYGLKLSKHNYTITQKSAPSGSNYQPMPPRAYTKPKERFRAISMSRSPPREAPRLADPPLNYLDQELTWSCTLAPPTMPSDPASPKHRPTLSASQGGGEKAAPAMDFIEQQDREVEAMILRNQGSLSLLEDSEPGLPAPDPPLTDRSAHPKALVPTVGGAAGLGKGGPRAPQAPYESGSMTDRSYESRDVSFLYDTGHTKTYRRTKEEGPMGDELFLDAFMNTVPPPPDQNEERATWHAIGRWEPEKHIAAVNQPFYPTPPRTAPHAPTAAGPVLNPKPSSSHGPRAAGKAAPKVFTSAASFSTSFTMPLDTGTEDSNKTWKQLVKREMDRQPPAGRQDVRKLQERLEEALQRALQQPGREDHRRIAGELQRILGDAMQELSRQIAVSCHERGSMALHLWSTLVNVNTTLVNRLSSQSHNLGRRNRALEAKVEDMEKKHAKVWGEVLEQEDLMKSMRADVKDMQNRQREVNLTMKMNSAMLGKTQKDLELWLPQCATTYNGAGNLRRCLERLHRQITAEVQAAADPAKPEKKKVGFASKMGKSTQEMLLVVKDVEQRKELSRNRKALLGDLERLMQFAMRVGNGIVANDGLANNPGDEWTRGVYDLVVRQKACPSCGQKGQPEGQPEADKSKDVLQERVSELEIEQSLLNKRLEREQAATTGQDLQIQKLKFDLQEECALTKRLYSILAVADDPKDNERAAEELQEDEVSPKTPGAPKDLRIPINLAQVQKLALQATGWLPRHLHWHLYTPEAREWLQMAECPPAIYLPVVFSQSEVLAMIGEVLATKREEDPECRESLVAAIVRRMLQKHQSLLAAELEAVAFLNAVAHTAPLVPSVAAFAGFLCMPGYDKHCLEALRKVLSVCQKVKVTPGNNQDAALKTAHLSAMESIRTDMRETDGRWVEPVEKLPSDCFEWMSLERVLSGISAESSSEGNSITKASAEAIEEKAVSISGSSSKKIRFDDVWVIVLHLWEAQNEAEIARVKREYSTFPRDVNEPMTYQQFDELVHKACPGMFAPEDLPRKFALCCRKAHVAHKGLVTDDMFARVLLSNYECDLR